jgi:hypothetical protein
LKKNSTSFHPDIPPSEKKKLFVLLTPHPADKGDGCGEGNLIITPIMGD